jgi:hypothetical protein
MITLPERRELFVMVPTPNGIRPSYRGTRIWRENSGALGVPVDAMELPA